MLSNSRPPLQLLVVAEVFFCAVTALAGSTLLPYSYDVVPHKVVFRWNVDSTPASSNTTTNNNNNITFSITVQDSSCGWIAFGIGETTSGSMSGSDLMVVENLRSAEAHTALDMYTTDHSRPVMTCESQQDWHLLSVEKVGTNTTIVATRHLDVHSNDQTVDRSFWPNGLKSRPVHTDTRLLIAWGASEAMSMHKLEHAVPFALNLFADRRSPRQRIQELPNQPGVHEYRVPLVITFNGGPAWSQSTCQNTTDWFGDVGREGLKRRQEGTGGLWALGFDIDYDGHVVHHVSLSARWRCSQRMGDMLLPASGHRGSWILPKGTGYNLLTYPHVDYSVHTTPGAVPMNATIYLVVYYTFSNPGASAVLFGFLNPDGLRMTHRDTTASANFTIDLHAPITLSTEFFHMHSAGQVMAITFSNATHGVYAQRRMEFNSYHGSHHYPSEPIVVHPGDTITTECRFELKAPTVIGPEAHNERCGYFGTAYPIEAALTREEGLKTGRAVSGLLRDAVVFSHSGPTATTLRRYGSNDLRSASEVTKSECPPVIDPPKSTGGDSPQPQNYSLAKPTNNTPPSISKNETKAHFATTTLVVAFAFVVGVVFGGMVMLLLVKKKKKKTRLPSPVQDGTELEEEEEEPQ